MSLLSTSLQGQYTDTGLVCLNLQDVISGVLQVFRLRTGILKFVENLALYVTAEVPVLLKSWLCAPCMLFC